MKTEPELLNERLDKLALVLDEIMPNCANLVRDALELMKNQEKEISNISKRYLDLVKVASKKPDIVRCKECKHRDEATSPYGEIWCKRNDRSVDGDWFCADGERKEGR